MNAEQALAALAALSHPTRLEAFRALVKYAPGGLSTGELVDLSQLSQSTFSTHLAVLAKAGAGHVRKARSPADSARQHGYAARPDALSRQ